MEQVLLVSRQRVPPYWLAVVYIAAVAAIFHYVGDPLIAMSIALFSGVLPILLGNRLLLFFVIAISFFFAQTPALPLNTIFFTTRWLLLGTGALVALVYPIVHPDKKPSSWKETKWIWIFSAFAFLSAAYSIAPKMTLERALALSTVFFVASRLVKPLAREYTPERLLDLLMICVAVPFCISTLLIGSPIAYVTADSTFQGILYAELVSGRAGDTSANYNRFHGFFINPNVIGLLAAIVFPVVLQKLLDDKKKIFYAFLFFMITLNLILSGSREGLLISFVGSVYVLGRRLGIKKIVMLLFFGLICIGTVLLPLISPLVRSGWLSRYLRLGNNLLLGGGRIEAWAVAIQFIVMRPFLGHGFGTEDELFRHSPYRFLYHEGIYAHSSYIGLAMQVGLVGTLLFFVPLFALFFSELRTEKPSPTRIALQGVLLAGLLGGVTESWIYAIGNPEAFMFWSLIALLEYLRSTESRKGVTRERPFPCGLQSMP